MPFVHPLTKANITIPHPPPSFSSLLPPSTSRCLTSSTFPAKQNNDPSPGGATAAAGKALGDEAGRPGVDIHAENRGKCIEAKRRTASFVGQGASSSLTQSS